MVEIYVVQCLDSMISLNIGEILFRPNTNKQRKLPVQGYDWA